MTIKKRVAFKQAAEILTRLSNSDIRAFIQELSYHYRSFRDTISSSNQYCIAFPYLRKL